MFHRLMLLLVYISLGLNGVLLVRQHQALTELATAQAQTAAAQGVYDHLIRLYDAEVREIQALSGRVKTWLSTATSQQCL